MMEPVRLTEMLGLAQGEVNSMLDLLDKHRAKRTRPDSWFDQHERILQHRRQVVRLIQSEIDRRAERKGEAA